MYNELDDFLLEAQSDEFIPEWYDEYGKEQEENA